MVSQALEGGKPLYCFYLALIICNIISSYYRKYINKSGEPPRPDSMPCGLVEEVDLFRLEKKGLLRLHDLQSTQRLSRLFIEMPDGRLRNGSNKLKQRRF